MKRIIFGFFIMLFGFVFVGCDANEEQFAGEITLIIIDYEGEEIFKGTISFNEDDTLVKLLEDHEQINMKGETASFGFYIVELVGINANDYQNVYWSIEVNDEYSMVGVSSIKLVDKSVIKFSLIGW